MEEILEKINLKITDLETQKKAFEHITEDAKVESLEQQLNAAIAARNTKAAQESAIQKQIDEWTEIKTKLAELEGE